MYNFLKTRSRGDLFFQIKDTFNDFTRTFHTSQFISSYQVSCSQVSEINQSNATNRHFDRTVNSLFCSQSVSLQLQQASDVSFASTDNRETSTLRKNRQNRQYIWRFQHRVQFSTFHHERRLINEFSQQTIVSVHSIVSRSNAAIWQADNFVNAFDDIDIECSSDNQIIVSAFDRSKSDAVFLTSNNTASASNLIAIKCSNLSINRLSSDRGRAGCSNVFDTRQSSVHLMASTSHAALTTSSRQPSACIRSFHGRVQHVWHHIQPPVHLMVSASGAAFLASKSTACLPHNLIAASHSFKRFSYVIGDRWSALIHIHLIKFPLKKDISHQHLNQDHLHIVRSICNLSEKSRR